MNSEWQTIKLGEAPLEIIDGDRGKNYPQKFSIHGYCLFLSAKNVKKTGFSFNDVQFIDNKCDSLLRKGKLNRGDIVLTTRGTVGNVAIYDESIPYDNVRINSGMVILRADSRYLDNYYLFYVLSSKRIQQQIASVRTGSAQPQYPISHMVKLEIDIPKLETQRTIVSILSSLDNKIANNIKINHHLTPSISEIRSSPDIKRGKRVSRRLARRADSFLLHIMSFRNTSNIAVTSKISFGNEISNCRINPLSA